jgi:hypothetical protein
VPLPKPIQTSKILICQSLDAVGRTKDTVLTAFTDGCSGLRRVLADAGITELPILDWFHIGMRLQHLKQTASGLSADDAARVVAKAVIVEEVERLHWRLWNGKAKDAQISIDRIRAVMHYFQGEQGERKSIAASRKLWTALHALDGYLTGESDWMVNYAERHRAGLRVGTAITEGTANFLVNRRMSKSQQMRWSRQGANLLLQVRCAVYNGTLGSGYGQRFHPANDTRPHPQAIAACPPNLRRSPLRQLDLSDTPVNDLEPLTGLAELRQLDLSGTHVVSLEPLKRMSALHTLYLCGTQFEDLRQDVDDKSELRVVEVIKTRRGTAVYQRGWTTSQIDCRGLGIFPGDRPPARCLRILHSDKSSSDYFCVPFQTTYYVRVRPGDQACWYYGQGPGTISCQFGPTGIAVQ